MQTQQQSKWGMPIFSLVMGLLLFAASALGGQALIGLGMFAVMVTFSAFLLIFSGRSETVAILNNQPIDERLNAINLSATAVAGFVAVTAALIGFLWSIAQGRDGYEFASVAISAGLAYLAALLWFRLRG
jgi:hypothetical protein